MYIKLSILLVIPIIITHFIHFTQGLLYCYSCRSREELGTCKDPFYSNEGLLTSETTPCASGWCTKMIETEDAYKEEYGTATERRCLHWEPPDNEERCFYTLDRHKKVYMCVCKGDLCNNTNKLPISMELITLSVIYAVYGWLS